MVHFLIGDGLVIWDNVIIIEIKHLDLCVSHSNTFSSKNENSIAFYKGETSVYRKMFLFEDLLAQVNICFWDLCDPQTHKVFRCRPPLHVLPVRGSYQA